MTDHFVIARENLSGKSEVETDGQKVIHRIDLVIYRKLESFRSRRLSGKTREAANGRVKQAGQSWMWMIRSLLLDNEIAVMQRQSALDGVKILVAMTVKNKIAIRDTKDILAAFDHQILDELVAAYILVNDDDGNLDIQKARCEPAEKYINNGKDSLLITFARSEKPCRQTVTDRVRKYGWPCFETLKEMKKREAL